MAGVIALIFVVVLWRFLILWGQAVFEAAGLSPEAAAFESRSALVGAGYTTAQSEFVAQSRPARRTAALLIVTGYLGPTVVLALLGVTFLLPSGDTDLTSRAMALVVLAGVVFLFDRVGAIRALGSRPANALARRMLAASPVERWVSIGDHAVITLLVPDAEADAVDALAVLSGPEVTLLATVGGGDRGTTYLTDRSPERPAPGDRVVVFGPTEALGPLGSV